MKNLLLVPALVLASSSGFAQTIYQKTDEFKGITVYFTANEKPKLDGGSFFSERYVWIHLVAMKPIGDASSAYSIQVDASLPSWMFMRSGQSLILKTDTETFPLDGAGSADNRSLSATGGVEEVALWSFPLSTLKKLAAAKTIQFKVYGDQGDISGTFSDAMMAEVRFFALRAPALIGDPTGQGQVVPEASKPTAPSTPSVAPTSPAPKQ